MGSGSAEWVQVLNPSPGAERRPASGLESESRWFCPAEQMNRNPDPPARLPVPQFLLAVTTTQKARLLPSGSPVLSTVSNSHPFCSALGGDTQ